VIETPLEKRSPSSAKSQPPVQLLFGEMVAEAQSSPWELRCRLKRVGVNWGASAGKHSSCVKVKPLSSFLPEITRNGVIQQDLSLVSPFSFQSYLWQLQWHALRKYGMIPSCCSCSLPCSCPVLNIHRRCDHGFA